MPCVSFITKPDQEKYFEFETHIKPYLEYEILDDDIFVKHDYQAAEGVALIAKIKEVAAIPDFGNRYPLVVDITSLCFNAWGGLPGTLTTSFMEKLTSGELYRLLEGWDDKSAYVMYSLGLYEDRGSTVAHIFQSKLFGKIVKPKISNASGWESCFQPNGYDKPYAELSQDVLIEISEKKDALRSLRMLLQSKIGVNFKELTAYDCLSCETYTLPIYFGT